jgi:hypothetical protein
MCSNPGSIEIKDHKHRSLGPDALLDLLLCPLLHKLRVVQPTMAHNTLGTVVTPPNCLLQLIHIQAAN